MLLMYHYRNLLFNTKQSLILLFLDKIPPNAFLLFFSTDIKKTMNVIFKITLTSQKYVYRVKSEKTETNVSKKKHSDFHRKKLLMSNCSNNI